ncbi:hypothetical protein SFC65_27480 [Priestia filamentosa]|uniref:hypothetical protein n=1 Tax=Priestia filamentosa TaxID=1402861 RepID=UPI0039828C1E
MDKKYSMIFTEEHLKAMAGSLVSLGEMKLGRDFEKLFSSVYAYEYGGSPEDADCYLSQLKDTFPDPVNEAALMSAIFLIAGQLLGKDKKNSSYAIPETLDDKLNAIIDRHPEIRGMEMSEMVEWMEKNADVIGEVFSRKAKDK